MIVLAAGLVLLPTIKDMTFQEACRERYALLFFDISSFEIIFRLLTEVVAFQNMSYHSIDQGYEV